MGRMNGQAQHTNIAQTTINYVFFTIFAPVLIGGLRSPLFFRRVMNSQQLTEYISSFMSQRLSQEDHFLVGVKVSNDLRRVTVLMDGDRGVDVDFCAKMSREIGEQLETMEAVPAYVLEVSSPGADAPMKILRQFPKHVGRLLQVRFKSGAEDMKGHLLQVKDEELLFRQSMEGAHKNKSKTPVGQEAVSIAFQDVEYARVIIQM